MKPNDATSYARLLLEAGVHFEEGMQLAVYAEPIHREFLTVLTEEAYRMGARFVLVYSQDPRLARARLDHSRENFLEYLPGFRKAEVDEMTRGGWARISIAGAEWPDLMQGVDGARNTLMQRALRKTGQPLQDACGSGKVPWTVAALPTPRWAAQVLGREPGEATSEALWDIFRPILRLDRDDPVAAWIEQAKQLKHRARRLNDCTFDAIHITAPGTDLEVGLIPGGLWNGGNLTTPKGKAFIPNLPTEEVYTVPDWRRLDGRLQVTRPVEVMGAQVTGAWFDFESGCVKHYGADTGMGQLDQFFDTDERARYAGELALVDGSSPIFVSGHVFHNILFDENAACHLALGSGFPTALPGAVEMSADERMEAGINQALVHTDFMFGCPEISVKGLDRSGSPTPILEQGIFCAPFAGSGK